MTDIRILSLPRFDGRFENSVMVDPETGKFETHGSGHSVMIGGYYCIKVCPTIQQLKKLRNDIDRYLKIYASEEK